MQLMTVDINGHHKYQRLILSVIYIGSEGTFITFDSLAGILFERFFKMSLDKVILGKVFLSYIERKDITKYLANSNKFTSYLSSEFHKKLTAMSAIQFEPMD